MPAPADDAGAAYPPIADHGLIGDCQGFALVTRHGEIDWCCMPRPDSPSIFGSILDRRSGGRCAIRPGAAGEISRRYVGDSMVLETTFRNGEGEATLTDLMPMPPAGRNGSRIVRLVTGVRGEVPIEVLVQARLEYGAVRPWVRNHGDGVHSIIGGHVGLVVAGSIRLEMRGDHDLAADLVVRRGETLSLSIGFMPPEEIGDEPDPHQVPDHGRLVELYDETVRWWGAWSAPARDRGQPPEVVRSALVIKSLSYAPTGAFLAAPTTSLPEAIGAGRNWDYRFSWVRDSAFSVRALARAGFDGEAGAFRKFIERSAAGGAEDLQPMYGVGGEVRLPEFTLDHLEGYRGSRPVRIGNDAYPQEQLDVYGYLLDLARRWHRRGEAPTGDHWRFLSRLCDAAADRWTDPDRGIWEIRGEPRHFVHSKVMCWAALDAGVELAAVLDIEDAPIGRWAQVRHEIRHAVETRGFDADLGCFLRSFDTAEPDAALLLLPWTGFVAFDDERMVATADWIRRELDHGGLVARYHADDGLAGSEGAFIACSFWLAECLARQGRNADAQEVFGRAVACGNDLGLFGEEHDAATDETLGNFPQALTHLSHISAVLALREGRRG